MNNTLFVCVTRIIFKVYFRLKEIYHLYNLRHSYCCQRMIFLIKDINPDCIFVTLTLSSEAQEQRLERRLGHFPSEQKKKEMIFWADFQTL